MQSCELVATITAIACAIANNCSEDEVALLSSAFNQLGDTLGTILAQESCNQNGSNNNQKNSNNKDESIKNSKNNSTDCNKDVDC